MNKLVPCAWLLSGALEVLEFTITITISAKHGVRKEMVAPLPIFRIHSFWLESFSVGGVATVGPRVVL